MNGAIGLAIGAVLGVVGYQSLSMVAAKVDREDTRKVLRIAALADLVIMPTLGFVIGSYVWPA